MAHLEVPNASVLMRFEVSVTFANFRSRGQSPNSPDVLPVGGIHFPDSLAHRLHNCRLMWA